MEAGVRIPLEVGDLGAPGRRTMCRTIFSFIASRENKRIRRFHKQGPKMSASMSMKRGPARLEVKARRHS